MADARDPKLLEKLGADRGEPEVLPDARRAADPVQRQKLTCSSQPSGTSRAARAAALGSGVAQGVLTCKFASLVFKTNLMSLVPFFRTKSKPAVGSSLPPNEIK